MRKRFGQIAEIESNPALQYALLGSIILLAAVLRFYKLGEWSFWIDEIFTVNRVRVHYGSLDAVVRNIPPTRLWFPLSLLLTSGALNTLGTSEWSARLVPAIIGVISVPALFFPIKRLVSPTVALIAVFLLAISPWHLYWSQNARFYTSLMLLYTLASLALFYSLEVDRPYYSLLFMLLAYLAVSERLIALFLIPVILCYLLALWVLPFEKPPGLRVRNIVLILLPGIAFVLFEIFSFVTTGSSILGYESIAFVGKAIDSPTRILILIVFSIGVPLASLAFFSGVYLVLKKSRIGLFLLLGATVPILIVVAMSPFLYTVERYVFTTLPCWTILGGIAVVEIFRWAQNQGKLLAVGVLFLLLADAAGAHLMYYQINHGNRPDWRAAFAYIQQRRHADDIIVSAVANVGSYYMQEDVLWLGDINPDTMGTGDTRYWVVIDSENGWWSAHEKDWVERNSQLVEAYYLRTREDMHLRIYLYEPERTARGK